MLRPTKGLAIPLKNLCIWEARDSTYDYSLPNGLISMENPLFRDIIPKLGTLIGLLKSLRTINTISVVYLELVSLDILRNTSHGHLCYYAQTNLTRKRLEFWTHIQDLNSIKMTTSLTFITRILKSLFYILTS